eukprot:SAG11_NODE_2444_length_3354_cov_2.476498_5_plen_284_part_00
MERIRGVPFLVHVRYAFQTPDRLFMVMDFMQGGELFFHLKKLGRFNQRAVQFYAAQMTLALEHLHDIDVIYRDLKPENVLLGADGYLCLTDFGLSKEGIDGETEGANSFCGTPEYVAPEVLKEGSEHGKAVDWWAMGTLLYEMLHGLPPFYSQNTAEMYEKIASAELIFPAHFSGDARACLSGMLERDPTTRFAAAQIRSHSWFSGVEVRSQPTDRCSSFKPAAAAHAGHISCSPVMRCGVRGLSDELTKKPHRFARLCVRVWWLCVSPFSGKRCFVRSISHR